MNTLIESTRRSEEPSSRPRSDRARWRFHSPGVLAALVLGLGISAFGDTPDPRSTTDEITSYFVRHRVDVFIGVVLVGVAVLAMLVIVSGLARELHVGGRDITARVAQSTATVVVGLIVVGLLLPFAGLSYNIGSEAPDAAKGLFALTILTTPLCALPLAACLGAIAIGFGRARLGAPWFVWFTAAAAVLMAVAGCCFAASGAFSPDVQQQVLFQLLTVWLIVSGFGRVPRDQKTIAPAASTVS